jgi:hypothetical protein
VLVQAWMQMYDYLLEIAFVPDLPENKSKEMLHIWHFSIKFNYINKLIRHIESSGKTTA